MFIDKIPAQAGENLFNVIIEIPMQSTPVKYEFDKEVGAIVVDRFMQVPMHYPCNYGFIPHTLSADGDPIDVLLLSQHPIIPGALIKVRPVGVLMMEDESGMDEKILAVPAAKLDATYDHIQNISDIDSMTQNRIQHFFENYKKLEPNKWVKITGWEDAGKALSLIKTAMENCK